MIKINCTSCQKPLSIDESKLPMKEVTFPCPSCKAKLKIDRRKLAGAPVAEAAVEAPQAEETYEEKALLVGNDSPQLRKALQSVGRQVVHFPTSEAARDLFLAEYPGLVVFSPGNLTAPPVNDMAPMLQVTPADRRKSFYVLVSDNLRTLDGNAAFLYNVNIVVATKDLGSFPQILREASAFHDKLYANLTALGS